MKSFSFLVLSCFLVGLASVAHAEPLTAVQPAPLKQEVEWPLGDAGKLGLSTVALEAHRAYCEETGADSCLVIFKGRIVSEWRGPNYRAPVYMMSSTKSVTGLLVGMLLEDGKIKSIDEPVCHYIEAWCSGTRAQVTLRHLLTHTSGLDIGPGEGSVGFVGDKDAYVIGLTPANPPGKHFSYSNEGAQLLSPILDRAAGEPIQNYAHRRLFEPLGMVDSRLHLDEMGHAWTYADMESTPREFARLGLLMLNKGMWQGKRIVSQNWIRQVTTASQRLEPACGLLWWILDEPRGFATRGHLDTDMLVYPDYELIVVRTQAKASEVPEGTYRARAGRLVRAILNLKARPRDEIPDLLEAAHELLRQGKAREALELASKVLQTPENTLPERCDAYLSAAYAMLIQQDQRGARGFLDRLDGEMGGLSEDHWIRLERRHVDSMLKGM